MGAVRETNRPDVSVVIVSYNCGPLLERCLRALRETVVAHTWEIIVADNGSVDETLAQLESGWPDVRVIALGRNTGFAYASNRGMAASSGRMILLLNPDTVVTAQAVDGLVRYLDATPNAGVVAPKLLNSDFSDQGTARAFPTAAATVFGRHSLLTRLFPDNRWSRRYLVGRSHEGDEPFSIDWVSGACMLVSREVISEVGPLDEGFVMYWEDADWCRRIKASGREVVCVPRAKVVHYEGGTRRGWPARQVWLFHSSAYRYFRKHHARGVWNPLRLLAGPGLYGRAAAIIAGHGIGQVARMIATRAGAR